MPDSAIGAVTELAASQHSIVTRSQAAHLGLSRARVATALRQGWLTEPLPGVLRVAGAASTYEQRVAIAVSAVDGTVASHRTAARLHRIDGFDSMSVIDVSTTRDRRWQLGSGVVPHHVFELADDDTTVINRIPVTSVARTLADLGAVVKNHRLVERAVTSARRRGVDVGFLHETVDRLHRPGPSGTGVLRRVLDRIPFEGAVTESWFEDLLARCLEHPDIGRVEPQYRIVDADGSVVARVDFAIPSVRLAIEAHSREFHFGPRAESLDEQRDVRLATLGWEVIYVGWHQAKQPADVAAAVAGVVRARRPSAA